MRPLWGFRWPWRFFSQRYSNGATWSQLLPWMTNAVTAPSIYGLTYLIGLRVLGLQSLRGLIVEPNLSTLIEADKKPRVAICDGHLGGSIIGLPLAIVGYYLSCVVDFEYQQNLKQRLSFQKNGCDLKRKASRSGFTCRSSGFDRKRRI